MTIFFHPLRLCAAGVTTVALVIGTDFARGQTPAFNEREQAKPASAAAAAPLRSWLPPALTNHSRWSFEFGVGIIGDSTPGDYLSLGFDRYDGPGSGLTYNFTAACEVYAFDWRIGKRRLRPAIEVPFMLTLVDEDDGEVIPDFNLGTVVRWRDFPWNRHIYTTFAVGVGLSYSTELWTADIGRHPGDDDRSQWKFWMPIEFTFALPRHPRHQLVLFIDHQSGGTIFDKGGVDAWGFGYRFLL
jgi:hypothetical protein